MLPFVNSKKGVTEAQFCLGYKGYIQLALRSGYYKKLNVLAIKKGELVKWDPLTETIEVNLIEDELEREQAETVGYYAMFEYLNGFVKAMYWSKQKMESHAKKYSKGYAARKGYTFWEKDFDGMAYKTMLRQLISKWGIMSTELQEAYEKDMATIREDGSYEYTDNVDSEEIIVQDEVKEGEIVKEGQVNLDEI
jgi:recombination protein RecT